MKKILLTLVSFLASVSGVQAFDWISEHGIFKGLTVQEFKQLQDSDEQAAGFESQSGLQIREGSGVFAETLTPAKNNLYDLGTSAKQWRNIYVAGTASVTGATTLSNLTITGTCIGCNSGGVNTSGTIAVGTSGTLNATSTLYHGLEIGTRSGFANGGLNIDPSGVINTSGSLYAWGTTLNEIGLNLSNTAKRGNFYVDTSGNVSASGSLTIIKTAESGIAENFFKFKVSDGGGGFLDMLNIGTGNNEFIPSLRASGNTANDPAFYLIGMPQADTGGSPAIVFDGRTRAEAELVTRPLFHWSNLGTVRMSMTAGGALVIGPSVLNAARLSLENGGIDIGGGVATTTVSSTFLILNKTTTNASGTFYVDSGGNIDTSGTIRQGRAVINSSSSIPNAASGGMLIPFATSTLTRPPTFIYMLCADVGPNIKTIGIMFGSMENQSSQVSDNTAQFNNSIIDSTATPSPGRINSLQTTSTNISFSSIDAAVRGGTMHCTGWAE